MTRLFQRLVTAPMQLRFLLTAAEMGVVSVLSLTPSSADPASSGFVWLVQVTPSLLQKALHVGFYAGLAISWMWALGRCRSVMARAVWPLMIAVGFGTLLEWLQTFVPGRFGSAYDIMLNTCGALSGLLLASLLIKRWSNVNALHR